MESALGVASKYRGAAEEMLRGIAYKELPGRGGIAAYAEEYTADAVWRAEYTVLNGAGNHFVFPGKLECVIHHKVEHVLSDGIFIRTIGLFCFIGRASPPFITQGTSFRPATGNRC